MTTNAMHELIQAAVSGANNPNDLITAMQAIPGIEEHIKQASHDSFIDAVAEGFFYAERMDVDEDSGEEFDADDFEGGIVINAVCDDNAEEIIEWSVSISCEGIMISLDTLKQCVAADNKPSFFEIGWCINHEEVTRKLQEVDTEAFAVGDTDYTPDEADMVFIGNKLHIRWNCYAPQEGGNNLSPASAYLPMGATNNKIIERFSLIDSGA